MTVYSSLVKKVIIKQVTVETLGNMTGYDNKHNCTHILWREALNKLWKILSQFMLQSLVDDQEVTPAARQFYIMRIHVANIQFLFTEKSSVPYYSTIINSLRDISLYVQDFTK
jgi:hypothetical protein